MNAAVRRIPSIAGTRSKLWKFLESLEPTCKKVHARMKAILEQEEVTVAKHGLEAVAAKKAGAVAGSSKDLADGVSLLETWAEQVKPLLSEAHQKDVERVKETGLGVCSICRWTTGCRHCSWVIAVRYWRRKETVDNHVEESASKAQLKPKAKPTAKMKVKGGGPLTLQG